MERTILIEKLNYYFREDTYSLESKNKYNEAHSFNEMPALELKRENTLFWLKNGRPHNNSEQISIIRSISSQLFNGSYGHLGWFVDGKYHRDSDNPSLITTEGTMIWFKRGRIHRDSDKPAIICNNRKIKAWYKNDFLYKRDKDKPNLIIGDDLFWIEMSENQKDFIIKKQEPKNKIDNFLQKKGIIMAISISILLYLIIISS